MVCGIRGNVWGNGAGIWGKPRGCVRTVDMEDTACVWEPSACMGNGNPMKARNMKPECGLRTLWIFGNVKGAAPRYEGLSRRLSYLSSLVELLLAYRAGGEPQTALRHGR